MCSATPQIMPLDRACAEFCACLVKVWMQVFRALVILLAVLFFVFACWAAYQAPKWSGKPRRERNCW